MTIQVFFRQLLALTLVLGYSSFALAQFNTVINIPPDRLPDSDVIEAGTQINLFTGGEIPDGYILDSNVSFTDIELNILGGTIGDDFDISCCMMNIESGTIGNDFSLVSQTLEITNGTFGSNGLIGRAGASSDIFDGVFGNNLALFSTDVFGGEFESVVARSVCFEGGNVSGTLEMISGGEIVDGTFNRVIGRGGMRILGGTIQSLETALRFNRISGGEVVGETVVSGEFDVLGGQLNTVDVAPASLVRFRDGTIALMSVEGEADLQGDSILGSMSVQSTGTAVMREGGTVDGDWTGESGSQSTVFGGSINGNVIMNQSATLRLGGREFRLVDSANGQLIQDLTPIMQSLERGATFEVLDRDVTLDAILADGSTLQIDLNSLPNENEDFVSTGAQVLITAEPRALGIAPLETTVFRGIVADGALEDIAVSDDFSLTIHPGFVLGSDPPSWLVFEGEIPKGSANVTFNVEARVGTPGLSYGMEAFNFQTDRYEFLESGDGNFGPDAIFSVDLPTDLYVDVDGTSMCRMYWRKTGFTINFPWAVIVDHAFWTAE